MKRLAEHNSEMFEKYGLSGEPWKTSDVACPKCEEEVAMEEQIGVVLTTHPPKVKVRCPKCRIETFKIV